MQLRLTRQKLVISHSTAIVTLHKSTELANDHLEQCFGLIKTTSGIDYKLSSIGWHPREKKKEMRDEQMWYLLVQSPSPTVGQLQVEEPPVAGFLSFMITYDDPPFQDNLVVYIYEIHLDKELRGSGLGTELMNMVKNITKYVGISKMMLTVFTKNTKARGFYEKLGFEKDQCSPLDREVRGRVIEADYVILSSVFQA
jgi:N-alpha-acetyltransferase 40